MKHALDIGNLGNCIRALGEGAAEENPQARLLLTQPGVGPVTALAFVLTGFPTHSRFSNVWDRK